MLTKQELAALMPVIDAGIRAGGLQVFANDGGMLIQSALARFQAMADKADDQADNAAKQEGETK